MKDYFELETAVEHWAAEKGILDKATPIKQALKTLEETTELCNAIVNNDFVEIKDAIGDIMVTLIIQAKMQGVTIEEYLNAAYDVISKRTGNFTTEELMQMYAEDVAKRLLELLKLKQSRQPALQQCGVSSSSCDKGYRGDCCCNCKRQVKINCHPSNGNQKMYGFLEDSIKVGKGSIMTTFGWGCEAFRGMTDGSDNNQIIFMDTPHGICEMHERL